MPPAKKPAARASASKRATPARKRATPAKRTASSRATSNGGGSMTAATRRQLEAAIKRLEKALDDASAALQSLAKDHGGSRAYRDLGTTLKALQREAQKHNKALAKDLSKVGSSVASRATRATTSARKATSSTRKSPSSARKTTTRRAAAKPATRRRAS